MESRFSEVRSEIRDQEADARVVPLDMSRKGPWLLNPSRPEEWTMSFDKRVLYANNTNQTEQNIFQASTNLNTELHAKLLKSFLGAQFPGVEFEIQVKPKFKTILGIPLKIPFTDIGWERAPNKIRGAENSFLASMPTNVTIKAKGNLGSINSQQLWVAVNQAACLHSQNEYVPDADNRNNIQLIATDLSARANLNPFKKLANFLSGLVPRAFAKAVIPESVREIARVNPYGYPVAQRVLDYPVINSGVAAHAANVGGALGVAAGVAAAAYFGFKGAKADYDAGNVSSTAGMGFFLGSNGASNPSLGQTMIANAIAHDSKPGSFANGYAHGVLFQRDIRLITAIPEALVNTASQSDGKLHAPIATRDVIRLKR
jgi:hypothetical protein